MLGISSFLLGKFGFLWFKPNCNVALGKLFLSGTQMCILLPIYFLFFRPPTVPEACLEGMPSVNNDTNKNDFFTRCGITWNYLTSTRSMSEFDDLRRRHQVILKILLLKLI